jgi:2-polyprenyl-3-methyl-5-hydroxy-6-metoxy-1,4-benzoquinol methylase
VSSIQNQERIRDDAQSVAYASDIARVVQEELTNYEDRWYSVLDIGPRTATGTQHLATLFHPLSWSRIKFDVTAMDIDEAYQQIAKERYPDLNYMIGDVTKLQDQFDVVICSHVIEHVPDPFTFFESIRRLAKKLLIVAAPYKEPDASRIPEHVNSIGDAFFERFPPGRLWIYKSPHWHNGECFIAVYRGV